MNWSSIKTAITPTSLKRRLVLWLTLGTFIFWLAAASLVLIVMMNKLNTSLDSALQETGQRLLALAVHEVFEHGPQKTTYEIARVEIAEHEEYLKYQLRDGSGRILLRSHDAPTVPYAAPLKTGFFDTSELRIYTEGAVSNTAFIQVAEPHGHRFDAVRDSALTLLAPLLLLIPVSAFVIIWIVNHAMAPVIDLNQAISLRGRGNLDPIGEVGLADELRPISEAVNRLLEKLRAALDAERAFAANSAHELRTPLASVLAQVQRLSATLDDDVARDRVLAIESDLKRLRNLTEKLLQLSRAESGVGLVGMEADLLPALKLVVEDFLRTAAFKNRLIFDDGGMHELRAHLDLDAFAIVMRNLIENALIHGSDDRPVKIFISKPRKIHVVSAGPALPADKLKSLTKRFQRGPAEADGSGLGLAIVDTIIQQADGKFVLKSPAGGYVDGFEAIVELA